MGVYLKKGNWYIDYYAYGKRKREKIGTSKVLAENVLRKRKLEIAENKYLDIRKEQKIKFEDFADTFLNLYSKPAKKSWKTDFHNLKAITPFFKGKYLYEITAEDIERFKVERSKEVAPATVNRALAVLKTMFNKAVAWGKLKNNPVSHVRFLKVRNQRLRYLEKEDIRKLLESSSGHLRPILICALFTGMRRGEILNLKWHDIDFQRGIIYLLDTKNGERREVPMNELVKNALISVRKNPDSPYIFCHKDGKPYQDIRKSFYTALKKSDIINLRFHDLRHTFASQLVMSGVDINTTRELLGHKDIRMTLRYSHLSPDHKKKAVEFLGRQMDTFWTPETILEQGEKIAVSELFENATLT